MKRLKFILFSLISFFAFNLYAQEYEFPKDWLGTWTGELEIFSGPSKVNSIPMQLEIHREDSSTRLCYFITYADNLRAYYLNPVDASNGRYTLEENNGIYIEMFMMGDRLLSSFEVQGSLITTMSYRTDSTLQYEIFAGRMEAISVTGDTIIGSDTIPPVQTFPITASQLATLRRSYAGRE